MFNEDFLVLLKSKTRFIWIQTYEEVRALQSVCKVLSINFAGMKVKSWSLFEGLKQEKITKLDETEPAMPVPPDALFREIIELQKATDENGKRCTDKSKSCLYILKDLHAFKTNAQITRGLRDVSNRRSEDLTNYVPVIVISPIIDINEDLAKQFTVIDFKTPDKKEVQAIVNSCVKKIEISGGEIPTDADIKKCVELSRGLTQDEIVQYLARSIAKYKAINTDIFLEARKDLIRKTGILEYKEVSLSIDEMGGNEPFKEWIDDVCLTFDEDAQDYGVDKSKGYLTIGPPGTAKTVAAEMVASRLNLPMLKLEMSKIMNSLVGASERNMAKAVDVIKACNPCVLFIDEIEKSLSGLGGAGNTGQSDGGALKRTFGVLLEYLSSPESQNTFTIMTSNDATAMPPELTRSGRLDTIWFFDLPTNDERKKIFDIHFKKRNFTISDEILNFSAENTENFSGAEIQDVVKNSIRNSFKRYKEGKNKDRNISEDDIKLATTSAVIVYNYSREKISALREYSKNRARFANEKSKNEEKHSSNINILKLT